MTTALDIVLWVLSLIWSVLTWLLWQILWIAIWVLLPIAVLAFVALRAAEWALGPATVRAWVKAQSMKIGAGAWLRARRLLFALGVLPLRVLAWLALYAVWHSLVSLFWRPRWSPWQRAWARRWRRQAAPGAR